MSPEPLHVLVHPKPAKIYRRMFEDKLADNIQVHYDNEPYDPDLISIFVSGTSERQDVEKLPYLKYIVIPWAGVPEEMKAYLPDFPQISVHNIHHNALPVAENTVALLLTAAKFIIPAHNALKKADWRPRYQADPSPLLYGKTALILGYGSIGHLVAQMLTAFGMRILATRNSIENPYQDGEITIFPSVQTGRLLPKANFLIVTLPLTSKTENLIGEKEIHLLPDGAVLVNIGRGKIVNQKALYESLKSGKLGSAAIDVWYNYPPSEADYAHTPPADYPFHELDNVVMSPHRAGGMTTAETERLRMIQLARLLNDAALGKELPNKVNLEKGY